MVTFMFLFHTEFVVKYAYIHKHSAAYGLNDVFMNTEAYST